MEAEIFKIICANQGAASTDELLFNLDFVNVSQVISNREKFVLCCPNGQPKVVARTGLRLCRAKDCVGTCRALHLCKNFLFSGSCSYTRSRRGCSFSHDLSLGYNQALLREHELESLSRSELCTLLLQSDNTLLPPICFDYNNGLGEFGRCQEGNGCKRMHICEESLKGECSCFRSHDFNDPQPLKCLKDKGVPEELHRLLKVIYTNKVALRLNDRGKRGKGQQRSSAAAAAYDSDASHDSGWNLLQPQVYRQTRRGGHRGNRGNRGKRGNGGNQSKLTPDQRAVSPSDTLDDIDSLNLYTDDGLDEWLCNLNSTGDISAAANDTDASSEDRKSRSQTPMSNQASASGRNQGNRGKQQAAQKPSNNDFNTAVSDKHANGSNDQNKRKWPVRDKTEICMYFIKGHCKHEDKCFKAHDKMPYRWEVKEGDQWKPLPNNEATEKDYCDPKNAYSSCSPPVYFDTMTRGTSQVRRLSTVNSLVQPTFIHTTEWLWYWEDECGSWNLYASAAAGRRTADIDSAYLEQKFLDNYNDVVEFTAGSQSYTLSFPDMIQTNKEYGTKRLVKRRPRFVSATDVQEKRVRRPLIPTLAPIPHHWDKAQIPATGYKRIVLQHTSDEFKEVEALFFKTMIDFNIVKIERIQNKSLWEVFQWQKNQMKSNNNGRIVTERKLFHGTDSKYVDPICCSNFDWRICGTHGTAFGKGSYFARDAKYSHSYTDDTDVKSMFVCRVLVGESTKGSPDYRRPPSKDGGDVNFFDSCVDNVLNPSVFVVFEKHQIYPEYLLQYKSLHPLVDLYGGASVTARRPAPKPRASVNQTTPSYQPAAPSYQPAAPSHQPAASSYQPAASSYQPAASSYQPAASSYQPAASSYQPAAPSYQPAAPSYQPAASSHQPAASSYQPAAPSYQPAAPSYQPAASSHQPAASSYLSGTTTNNPSTFTTFSYQPSTRSYQTQLRQSPPSLPSPRKAKKSDSCIIA